jgi:hypothetical protein
VAAGQLLLPRFVQPSEPTQRASGPQSFPALCTPRVGSQKREGNKGEQSPVRDYESCLPLGSNNSSKVSPQTLVTRAINCLWSYATWVVEGKQMPVGVRTFWRWFPKALALSATMTLALVACNNQTVSDARGSASVRESMTISTAPSGWDDQQLRATAMDGIEPVDYGRTVAVFDNLAMVGAPGSLAAETPVGIVYAFVHRDGIWQPIAPILSPEGSAGYVLGSAIAISNNSAAIAAGDTAGGAGRVWLYSRNSTGGVGNPVRVEWKDPLGPASRFGSSLALDDESLLVGDPLFSGNTEREGAVYAFARNGKTGQWEANEMLRPTGDSVAFARFGSTLALNGDTLVVGAPTEGDGQSGAAYVFERGGGGWEATQRVAPTKVENAGFGRSVAITSARVFVGAPFDNDSKGAVYAFERGATGWEASAPLVTEDGEQNDEFGAALAASEGELFVGASRALAENAYAGRIQVFSPADDYRELGRFTSAMPAENEAFGAALAIDGSTLVVGSLEAAYLFAPALGRSCLSGSDCMSGHCVDEVCCDQACDGMCESCRAADQAKGKDGVCGSVAAGKDPDDDCAQGDTVCGATGSCDGGRDCELAKIGTMCAKPTCSAGQEEHTRTCDGEGRCPPGETSDCEVGYGCRGDSCQSACERDEDCATGYFCHSKACIPGESCLDNATLLEADGGVTECAPRVCRDGHCLMQCETVDDCDRDHVCHPFRHECVTESELAPHVSSAAPSCNCATPRQEPSKYLWSIASLVGLGTLHRRRALRSPFRKSNVSQHS